MPMQEEEERAPSMVPLGMLLAMLALMFIFILAILGVVGNMHANGVWEKTCSDSDEPLTCPVQLWEYATADEWGGTCATGTSQSPININTASVTAGDTSTYTRITAANFVNRESIAGTDFLNRAYLEWANNVLGFRDIWTYFDWSDKSWRFQRATLHMPSEHAIDGVSYDAEVQITYLDNQANAVVLSFIGDRTAGGGGQSPTFITDLALLGTENMGIRTMELKFDQVISGLRTNVCALEGESTECVRGSGEGASVYWSYDGSLSHPPCTEGVKRLVFKEIFTVRVEDYDRLVNLPKSARPTQPLNDRPVYSRGA